MIGFLSGKFLTADDNEVLVDVGGVGYSVLVPSRTAVALQPGQPVELFIHTNLRENALELFGFSSAWEKKVFQALTSVSGVGPRTAVGLLGGLEPEMILSAVVREDRATLTSVSGVGKKTAERFIVEIADKARRLLAERPASRSGATATAEALVPDGEQKLAPASGARAAGKARPAKEKPAAGATAQSSLDIADLWNEALAALVGLGYREGDAIQAIKAASAKTSDAGEAVSLEKLIRSSLQLMAKGM